MGQNVDGALREAIKQKLDSYQLRLIYIYIS